MALKDKWQDLIDGESEVVVEPINDMAHSIIELEEDMGDIDTALDAILTIQEGIIGGDTE